MLHIKISKNIFGNQNVSHFRLYQKKKKKNVWGQVVTLAAGNVTSVICSIVLSTIHTASNTSKQFLQT